MWFCDDHQLAVLLCTCSHTSPTRSALQHTPRWLQEEREEKALRKAEMEVAKASNLLEHEAEIMARPRRDWFLSGREKAEIAKAAKPAATAELSEKQSAAAQKASRAAKGARNADAKGVSALYSWPQGPDNWGHLWWAAPPARVPAGVRALEQW